jgi:excisionase family DNA binding protein
MMQIERTQNYRVKMVAAALDVSVATIYRAIKSGELRAQRIGTGKGTVRIPGDALLDYKAACERAALEDARDDNPMPALGIGGVA